MVDRPVDRRYAGPCGAERDDEYVCDVDLYAHPDDSWVSCPGCGAHWDVADRRAWLMDKAQDYWADLEEAGAAMTDVDGHTVPVKTLRTWINRGKLDVRGWVLPIEQRQPFSDNVVLRRPYGDDGKPAKGYTPLVRVGDVAEIVRKRHADEKAG